MDVIHNGADRSSKEVWGFCGRRGWFDLVEAEVEGEGEGKGQGEEEGSSRAQS